MFIRRVLIFSLILITMLYLSALVSVALVGGGLSWAGVLGCLMYVALTPWLALGFWSCVIGMLLLRFYKDPLLQVMPKELAKTAQSEIDAPLWSSTALLLCVRDEELTPIIHSLCAVLDDLVRTPHCGHFHMYILSDSTQAQKIAHEASAFEDLKLKYSKHLQITYRLRTEHSGFKAGNVMDFCRRFGDKHDFALTLDADSYMSPKAIIRLVRMMQSDSKLGILQGLVIAMPTLNAFTRLFQFGMRLGMRAWTLGNAWWQGDCGPYWGHNAVFRIAPFTEFCDLPLLSPSARRSRHILSHDQVEAVLMRRAGFDVRVLPFEDESWEQNPPNLPEFIRRDLRWCEGNLQYGSLLFLPNLRWVSRVQLLLAMLMFTGAPGWIGLIGLGTLVCAFPELANSINGAELMHLFWVTLVMFYVPKLVSALEIILDSKQRADFGGLFRFTGSFLLETCFSLLLSPIMWLSQTLFMAKLLFGMSKGWATQAREGQQISFAAAAAQFWPHTLLGALCIGAIAWNQPGMIFFALFYTLGLLVSIPLTVFLSTPELGLWMHKVGIARLPEETTPPAELLALGLAACVIPPRQVLPSQNPS